MPGKLKTALIATSGPLKGLFFKLVDQGQPLVVGRGDGGALRLGDDRASRRHAHFLFDGCWHVEDLLSRNGTFVNDVRIFKRTPLTHGDRVQIGNTIFLVSTEPEEIDVTESDLVSLDGDDEEKNELNDQVRDLAAEPISEPVQPVPVSTPSASAILLESMGVADEQSSEAESQAEAPSNDFLSAVDTAIDRESEIEAETLKAVDKNEPVFDDLSESTHMTDVVDDGPISEDRFGERDPFYQGLGKLDPRTDPNS